MLDFKYTISGYENKFFFKSFYLNIRLNFYERILNPIAEYLKIKNKSLISIPKLSHDLL